MIPKLHKNLIICAYALTIIFAVAGLGMFFIEQPYKGERVCPDKYGDERFTIGNGNGIGSQCTITEGKEPSLLMQWIINLALIFGALMIILSILAFYDKKKHPGDYPGNLKEEPDKDDSDNES
jgi:hypothetical protein